MTESCSGSPTVNRCNQLIATRDVCNVCNVYNECVHKRKKKRERERGGGGRDIHTHARTYAYTFSRSLSFFYTTLIHFLIQSLISSLTYLFTL